MLFHLSRAPAGPIQRRLAGDMMDIAYDDGVEHDCEVAAKQMCGEDTSDV
jgi:hypothetical protein